MTIANTSNPVFSSPTYKALPNSPCLIKKIPFELVLLCLSSLSARDLSQASQVNKQWHALSKGRMLWKRLVAPFSLSTDTHLSPFVVFGKTPWVARIAANIQRSSYLQRLFDPKKEVTLYPKLTSQPRFTFKLSLKEVNFFDGQNNNIKTIDLDSFIEFWDNRTLVQYDSKNNCILIQDLYNQKLITRISLGNDDVFIDTQRITLNQHFLSFPIFRNNNFATDNFLFFDLKKKVLLSSWDSCKQTSCNQMVISNDEAAFQLTPEYLNIKPFSKTDNKVSFQLLPLVKETGITLQTKPHVWQPQKLCAFGETLIAQISVSNTDQNLLSFAFDTKTKKLISAFNITPSDKQAIAYSEHLLAYCNREKTAIDILFVPTGKIIRQIEISSLFKGDSSLSIVHLYFKDDQTLIIKDSKEQRYLLDFA